MAYEASQPWVVYYYGATTDRWWPLWRSTRILGRCRIDTECAVCGTFEKHWLSIPRFGPVNEQQERHPMRVAFLQQHAHPDRPHPMAWAKPLLNPRAHPGGVDLDLLAMRLQADAVSKPNKP